MKKTILCLFGGFFSLLLHAQAPQSGFDCARMALLRHTAVTMVQHSTELSPEKKTNWTDKFNKLLEPDDLLLITQNDLPKLHGVLQNARLPARPRPEDLDGYAQTLKKGLQKALGKKFSTQAADSFARECSTLIRNCLPEKAKKALAKKEKPRPALPTAPTATQKPAPKPPGKPGKAARQATADHSDYYWIGALLAAALLVLLLILRIRRQDRRAFQATAGAPAWTMPPDVPAGSPNGQPYFVCEAMVTAGPRKAGAPDAAATEMDMGEDTAGVVVAGTQAFFWCLDGTSDADSVLTEQRHDVFSSRLLAQTIAWQLNRLAGENPEQTALQMLHRALEQTRADWTERLRSISATDKEKLLDRLRQQTGWLQCSTNFILGKLQLDGRLDACIVGDGHLVVHPPGQVDIPPSNGRQFCALQLSDDEQDVVLYFNDPDSLDLQRVSGEGVRTVIAATDGVSAQMATWLQQLPDPDFSSPELRQAISRIRQGTLDDKTLLFVQIKQPKG
ncbi:MAG: hypothetical protein IT260_18325 [Saprospiraceae bacterium]|nr:hypothetical protein [Saprospiraceae bacterium]